VRARRSNLRASPEEHADENCNIAILVLMVDPIDGVSGAACRLPELDVVLINRREVPGRRHFDLETQTGRQRRRVEQQIDRNVLRATLKAIHPVSDAEKAAALLRDDQVRFLDAGEMMLWAHTLGRADVWVLCGPDKASLRVGIRLGFRDRLVSLEGNQHHLASSEAMGRPSFRNVYSPKTPQIRQ
jgi:hypothetical protein